MDEMLQDYSRGGISLQPVERTTPEQISTLQAMEDSTLEEVDISERIVLCDEDPHWTKEKGGKSGQEELLRTDCNPNFPFPCTTMAGCRRR